MLSRQKSLGHRLKSGAGQSKDDQLLPENTIFQDMLIFIQVLFRNMRPAVAIIGQLI